MPVRITCDGCKMEYEIADAQARYKARRGDKHNFCSNACSGRWLKEHGARRGALNAAWRGGGLAFTCRVCKTEFRRRISKARSGGVHYCSVKCQMIGMGPLRGGPRVRLDRSRLKDEVHLPAEQWKVGYFAGFLDGEGSVTIRQQGYQKVVQLVLINTARNALEWIQREFGGGGLSQGHKSGLGKKPIYALYYEARLEVKKILEAVLPYLQIKRARVEAALEVLSDLN